ncbi:hypothetical protein OC25_03635 [Pedobacter kyungheensis]|uniref:DUF2116 family Zn-ribbon domain-containing protein n=2 Tax=Pedobacter TaxID=84567 RepID=A0A1G6JYR0_9SPHI|nr:MULTISPECIES: hypothetical protein [Pedobacter]KIA96186.1 hypothetical protein OC25_03635 [Pedobacter kyungheensis]SDC23847.1 hypothetical protein SAMN04488024_101598 [Pedobacter soli]
MSNETPTHEKPRCRYCDKILHGRAGKIFCNVDCKNNYNSRIRSVDRAEENKRFPDVIKTIKNNYRVLKQYRLNNLKEGEIRHIRKDELRRLGFDHRFCTGAALEGGREMWKCCFEFCWKEDMNWLTFKIDPDLNTRYNY